MRLLLQVPLLCALAAHAAAASPERLFPPSSPVAARVDVADFRNATPEWKLAATTLEGLINDGPEARAYLLLSAADAYWLARMREKNQLHAVRERTPEEFFADNAPLVERVFVYDPALPATINVATMLASLERGIVAAPDDAERLMPGKPVEDLRGRWPDAAAVYPAFTAVWYWAAVTPNALLALHADVAPGDPDVMSPAA